MVDSPDDAGFEDLLAHSITYRIALGPHQGRKAFTLQTVPAVTEANDGKVAKAAGFSLNAFSRERGARARKARAFVPLHHAPSGLD
jgi:hypothetical protein